MRFRSWTLLVCLVGLSGTVGCGSKNDGGSPQTAAPAPSVAPPASSGPSASGSGMQPPVSNPTDVGAQQPVGMNTPPPSAMAGSGAIEQPPVSTGVTYHKDIRALLEQNCLGCHVAGGVGPFPLDTWEAVQRVAGPVVMQVASGHMPPWPADVSCHEMHGVRSLTTEARGLFAAWQSAGFPEGTPADYKALPPLSTGRDVGAPSLSLANKAAYTPAVKADDYHCFVLDHVFASDTYLTAMDIVPDQRAEVHHVQIHRVSSDQLAQVQALDDQSPEPGYSCLAGTGTNSQNMFSWRPGGERVVFDDGDAAFVEKGSSFVIQVHYNTQFLPDGQSPTPDQTKIAVWTLPDGKLPDRVIYRTGVFGPVDLPAGDPSVVSDISQPMSTVSAFGGLGGFGGTFVPGEIIGMTPHAHQIASKMVAHLQHAGGGDDCLVNVPEWDFHWQLDYMFMKGVPYTANDMLVASCEYDNSEEHQPIVDGVMQAPRNVTFGEGSLDEMCLHYVWLRMDRAAFLAALGR
jgi:hypothetical protein